MAALTICSDFRAQKNKVSHCFQCFPIYLPWSDGTGCHDLSFLNEMMDWINHKVESNCWEKYQQPQIGRSYHSNSRKWRGTKKPLDESERGEWKSWLKAQHLEIEDHSIWSHHFMGNRWGNSGNSGWLYFSGLQNHCRWWLQPWN